jgi:uncharacterized protein (TIGR00297 family)
MIFAGSHHLFAILIILVGAVFSVNAQKLTFSGAFAGASLAAFIYVFAGYTGLAMLTAFFITGTLATFWKKEEKQKILDADTHQIKRNAAQVVANAAIPALLSALIYPYPEYKSLLQLMIGGSLASATADTLSSELGMIYGRRFYNILSLKSEAKGLDGVVSLEGTLIGVAGAAFIALIYTFGYRLNDGFWIIVVAGIAGNFIDSLLGAALERKGLLTNDLINFFNTFSAALVSGLLFCVYH